MPKSTTYTTSEEGVFRDTLKHVQDHIGKQKTQNSKNNKFPQPPL